MIRCVESIIKNFKKRVGVSFSIYGLLYLVLIVIAMVQMGNSYLVTGLVVFIIGFLYVSAICGD